MLHLLDFHVLFSILGNKEGNTPDVSSEAVVPVLVSNTTEATAAVIDVSTPYVPVPKTKAAVIDISTPDVPKTKGFLSSVLVFAPFVTNACCSRVCSICFIVLFFF